MAKQGFLRGTVPIQTSTKATRIAKNEEVYECIERWDDRNIAAKIVEDQVIKMYTLNCK